MKRFVLMVAASVLLSLSASGQGTKQLTIDDVVSPGKFRGKSLGAIQWVGSGKKYSSLEYDTVSKAQNLIVTTVADQSKETVMSGAALTVKEGEKPFRIASYQWSTDGSKIIVTGSLPARRMKTGGNFGVFDVAEKKFRMLTDAKEEQAIVKISPDGKTVGFVRANNLWIIDIASGKETQLTSDGSDVIINGKFDWVYEEEFSIIDGWQWSPDGKRIAFWRLDQSKEPKFPLVRYSADDAHAEVQEMRYPKPGDPNAEVKVGIITLDSLSTRWVDVGTNSDIYIPRIKWTNDPEKLAVERLNRGQDTLDILIADAGTGKTKLFLTETDSAWLEPNDSFFFIKKTGDLVWTSARDGHTHIYIYTKEGKARQVTRGDWEVFSVQGVDEEHRVLFFTASVTSPLEKHLYSIAINGGGMTRLTKEAGTHGANVAPDGSVFIDTWSSIEQASTTDLRKADGSLIARLVANTGDALAEYALGKEEFFAFTTPDGTKLNGSMLKPPGFDPGKKYPVFMSVYGGPRSQTVQNSGGRRDLWSQYLAERGYVIVSVDNRGTGGRGEAFMKTVDRQLGVKETADQVAAARYLGGLPYVDSTRIGIWGWSYGGYMTCMAMTLGAPTFKMGIAVAPVTHWKFYDSIYTERFMHTPSNNAGGYAASSPITYADRMQGKLLIAHGTTDDNVHLQNSIVFVNELIRLNKQVRTMFYPGRDHGIRGDNATRHLYTMMSDFILETL